MFNIILNNDKISVSSITYIKDITGEYLEELEIFTEYYKIYEENIDNVIDQDARRFQHMPIDYKVKIIHNDTKDYYTIYEGTAIEAEKTIYDELLWLSLEITDIKQEKIIQNINDL